MGIKNKLQYLMSVNKVNVCQLAEQCDVSPNTIYSLLKRNSTRINIELLNRLASALSVSVDFLTENEDYDSVGNSLLLSSHEIDFVLKLRQLDSYGIDAVKAVICCELNRIKESKHMDLNIAALGNGKIEHTTAVDREKLAAELNKLGL